MPENNIIKSDRLCVIAQGQAVVEARQMLGGEARVLSVSAQSYVKPSEVFSGEVRYTGRVRFDCLAIVDGGIRCISTIAEFSDRITSPDITSGTVPVLVPEVVNCEASISDGTLKTVAVVDTELSAVTRSEVECITRPDDGIFARSDELVYGFVTSTVDEALYITDSMPGGKAAEILCAYSRAVVTGSECATDEVRISGGVYTTAIVKSEDGLISAQKQVTPFSKTVSAMGAGDGCVALATVCPDEVAVSLAPDADDDRIDISVTLRANIAVVCPTRAQAVTDVFCVENALDTTRADITLCDCMQPVTVIDTVDGQVALDKERAAADNVLCINNTFCTVTEAHIENGAVCVEGLVGGDIVYYSAEKNAADSVAFRLPFAMPLSLKTEASEVSVRAVVTDVNVKVRRESVFDVKAELAFCARMCTVSTASVVCGVKRGEKIERPDATVIVHIAKPGETLWQAARALCCSPDEVLEQNDAKPPYSGGERLVGFCNRK